MLFHCDNLAVVYSTNKQTAKDPHLMKLIRRLVIQALRFNIFFSARHIPGLRNVIADKLSRLQMVEFRRVARHNETLLCLLWISLAHPQLQGKYDRVKFSHRYM
jgi:hypothetical protein